MFFGKKYVETYRSANIAWVINEVVAVAQIVRTSDRCMGELSMRHLDITDRGILRSQKVSWLQNKIDEITSFLHQKYLHDSGCVYLGVSKRSLIRLIRESVPKFNRDLLVEAIEESFIESNSLNSNLSLRELIELHIGLRISALKPDLINQ
ncbi:MAG TPA: hypothetical protein VLZ31_05250 [Microbacteriaceae bacterium]|nr:hypothetical protein [Microbacteriaceae bacterium]